jgi:hypothetical protein
MSKIMIVMMRIYYNYYKNIEKKTLMRLGGGGNGKVA